MDADATLRRARSPPPLTPPPKGEGNFFAFKLRLNDQGLRPWSLLRALTMRGWSDGGVCPNLASARLKGADRVGGADELRERLQAALGPNYAIERELGRGGMATVFLALDAKHKRPVALKVLHAELAASLGPERFRREVELAARLQHPHILSVLDSGEAPAGLLWFTMPLVEGESLRDRLTRERQLPVAEALRIARETALALDYAHRHGVIHRDVKPENILLTSDGQALVADFGIARALAPGAKAGVTLTETGVSVGTPAYMSPEQASAERTIDARTDVYSLGAVLYEMLAGEPPFTGPSVQAIVAKQMAGDVPSIRRVRPAVPESVDAALSQALALIPADRFATAKDFATALDVAERTTTTRGATAPAVATPAAAHRRFPAPATTLVLGFLVGVGVLFAWRSHNHATGTEGAAGPVRLAVLPFENLGDSADGYFADGMTDAVREKLTALPGLQVIARASSGQYRHTSKSMTQIGQELGARYLVVGTVRWAKGGGATSRVEVRPELVDAGSAADKWEQSFDAPLTDVFQVEGDIAGRVVQALGVALNPGTRESLAERPTENLAAYDAYLKGEEATRVGLNDPILLQRAVRFFGQAVALDSTFAPAWAGLAEAEATLYYTGSTTPEHAEAARRASERARALAPDRPDTHLAQGVYYELVLRDYERALAEYSAGLKVAPSNAQLLTETALVEQSLGRWDASLTHLRQSQALDPRDVLTARRLATAYLWLRRYPEASAASDRAVVLAPENLAVVETSAMVHLAQGDLAGARAAIAAAPPQVDRAALAAHFGNYWDLYWVLNDSEQRLLLTLSPVPFGGDRAPWATVMTETYALRGDAAKSRVYADSARLAFEEVLRATPEDAQSHAILGIALAYMGRKADAVREGEHAVNAMGIARDGYTGPYLEHVLARTYVLVGEHEKALDVLESLLKVPYFLSPGWLKVDPTWAPLRGNPRFERLVAGG